MSEHIILGNRRLTCLSPTLVRMEYAPDGRFEDRSSIVASETKTPIAFTAQECDGEWTVLKTEALCIRLRDHDQPYLPLNTEVRWRQNHLLQAWRPGDSDYRNLGGTLRSLDRYDPNVQMQGAHVADLSAPDAKGMRWLVWLDCEEDPVYWKASPDAPKDTCPNRHAAVTKGDHGGGMLERSYNCTDDAHRFSTGVLSRSGYWLLNDSESAVLNDDGFPVERNRHACQDWYFFGYGNNYATALQDFRNLCGPAPLPTKNALGIMFSRWPAYDEQEAKDIIRTFDENGYPLSVIVLDMEWHKEGWGHWEWDDKLYPDPAAFFRYCHEKNIHVTLNDHPLWVRSDDSHFEPYLEAAGTRQKVADKEYNEKTLPMVEVDVCRQREAEAFFEVCHTHILEQGIDFWWNDGYCGEMHGAIGQLVMNKLSFEDIEKTGKRGMLLARYGGLGSHRYGGFFTGDTTMCWEVLRLQVEFNVRAAGVGMAWVSHDIGGFCGGERPDGRMDPELYLRWLQFGVFNPMLRLHSAPNSGSRQPWDYTPEGGDSVRHWMQVRNSLLPYIYSAGRVAYETGMPLVRGLYLDQPTNNDAYTYDAFLFGPQILVAPVTTPGGACSYYLPDGVWWTFERTSRQTGGVRITQTVPLDQIPVYVKSGSILLRQDPQGNIVDGHVEALHLDLYDGCDGDAVLYEDDTATTAYKDGAFCKTLFRLTQTDESLCLTGEVAEGSPLKARRDIRITLSMDGPIASARLQDGTTLEVTRNSATGQWELMLQNMDTNTPFELQLMRQ